MPLASGTRLGAYDIELLLGAGGMGEVYKAHDRRLQRSVAIKILLSATAADPERLARFEREARVLASLNHPNIAQIYGVEEAAGAPALIMEFVDGKTLDSVLAQRDRPRPERARADGWSFDPLSVARQLAEALEAAHEQHIVHRDLKPQNVILTVDGIVKVLDFGLARILDPEPHWQSQGISPTITNAATRVGTVLGTAAYMAPEQAKGHAADHRADIWAFGAILFELWTGRGAFTAPTLHETLARVLERDPDWKLLQPLAPPAIVRLIQRALVKEPRRRLQAIGDARLEIDDAAAGQAVEAAPVVTGNRSRRWLMIAPTLAACTVIGGAAGWWARPAAPDRVVLPVRASIALPPGLALHGGGPPEFALSPDGRTLAFIARSPTGLQRLYVRGFGSDTASLVPDSESGEGPFFSPDGRWLGFSVGVSELGSVAPELRKYSLETGLTQTISRIRDFYGAVWLEDGDIVFVDQQPKGVMVVNSAGGEPRPVPIRAEGQQAALAVAWPARVPHRRAVILTDWAQSRVGHLAVADLDTNAIVNLGIEGTGGQVLPNGYLVYASPSAALMAVRFDIDRLRVVGTAMAVMPDIPFARNNAPRFAFSGSGTLVFAPGYVGSNQQDPLQVVRVSSSGETTPLPFERDLLYHGLELSPDGTRLAVGASDASIWILDLVRGTRQRLPPSPVANVESLAWHPDGRRLAISGPVRGASVWAVVVSSLSGARTERLFDQSVLEAFTAGWLPPGGPHIAWTKDGTGASILRSDDGRFQPLFREASTVRSVRVSPDGRWIAYDSAAEGTLHVYAVSSSGKGDRILVSSRPGETPRWSPDGRQLFFRSGTALMSVDIRNAGQQIEFSTERKLFDAEIARDYTVGRDGVFYTIAPVPGAPSHAHVQIRTGWFDEVESIMRKAERPQP